MLWIIQDNLDNDNKRGELLHALNRLSIPFIIVTVKNNTITPNIPLDNNLPIITNGSIMLSNIANNQNWYPGSLFNTNFSYHIWADYYKNFILNKNATITTLKEAQIFSDKVFVRPILDTKSFNGKVFTKEEFLSFQVNSINGKAGISPDIEILLSQPQTIGQEHRHYIVNGEIVTSSRYKLSGQPNFSEGADPAVIEVVIEAIKTWVPARAFVLDTFEPSPT